MSDIAKNEGFVFAETSLGENYIIKKNDMISIIIAIINIMIPIIVFATFFFIFSLCF